jgi:hypothetical protein
MQLIQVVSRLPPAIDGVGDYSCLLARQLRAAHGIHTTFVVCDPEWKMSETEPSPAAIDGFPVHQLKQQSAGELWRLLSQPQMPALALLQYVGYGYQKRGCPVWLARGLRAWKNENQKSGRQLLTMFHELYASGPLWSSAFWASPVQKWITKSLAQMSAHGFTNLAVNARILKRLTARAGNDFSVLPVFSNVGEPEKIPGWKERPPRLIVFGSAGQRRKVYFEGWAGLEKTCRALGLDEIVDIGAPLSLPQLSVRISRRGILPGAEVSREMLNARAGFFVYPTAYLGKSGIFAAYAAHGLLPVTVEARSMKNEDALNAGEHFLRADDLGGSDAGKIAAGARRWYQANGTKNLAARFANVIQKSSRDVNPESAL